MKLGGGCNMYILRIENRTRIVFLIFTLKRKKQSILYEHQHNLNLFTCTPLEFTSSLITSTTCTNY